MRGKKKCYEKEKKNTTSKIVLDKNRKISIHTQLI